MREREIVSFARLLIACLNSWFVRQCRNLLLVTFFRQSPSPVEQSYLQQQQKLALQVRSECVLYVKFEQWVVLKVENHNDKTNIIIIYFGKLPEMSTNEINNKYLNFF